MMSTVVMHNVVSVDGYIADENDEVGPLFDWYFNGDHPLVAGEMDEPAPGGMRVSKGFLRLHPSDMGRHRVDGGRAAPVRHDERLGGQAAGGEHVVVVSHRPKPDGWHPEASYHFVDDVAAAIATAKELAGERTVAVAAG